MRVIAGSKRGLKLEAPAGAETTRPTSDRVKEAVFGSIQNRIVDSVVLDLFAGSGALGIEAISRGAKKSVFVEKNKEPLDYLNRNLTKAGFADKAIIYAMDHETAMTRINEVFDIIFLDPPYRGGLYESTLSHLLAGGMIGEDTLVVVEYLAQMDISIPKGLTIEKSKKYGKTGVVFLKKETGM